MFTDVISSGIGVFKKVKEYRASKDPLPNDEAGLAQALDDNLTSYIESPKGALHVNEINEKVVGTDLKGSQLDIFNAETQSLLPAENASIVPGYDSMVPGESIAQEIGVEPPADLPPTARKGWKEFATSENFLKLANVCLGIAFTVAMAFDLKDNWDSFTDVGKVLNVMQIVIQGLTVIVDAAALLADALATAGIWAADCIMMVTIPIVGAVFAVIGVIVMIVLSILDVMKPKEPPPSPVEAYITDVARPWVTVLESPPPLSLTYQVQTSVKAGSSNAVPITATNNTAGDVTLTRTTVTLEAGEDAAALFSSPIQFWVLADKYDPKTSPLTNTGTVGVGPASLTSATLVEQDRGTSNQITLASYDLAIIGPQNAGLGGPLKLSKGQTVNLGWLGVINTVGTTTLQVVEKLSSGDSCRFIADIFRS